MPQFQGLERRKGSGTEQVSSTTRQALNVSSSDDLKQVQSAGQRLITEFADSGESVRGSTAYLSDALTPNVIVADMPRTQPQVDTIQAVVERQVEEHWSARG